MATHRVTPSDLVIHRRDMKFGREAAHPRWWLGEDPGRTAFFNALSSTFPIGEKFFMTSVKHFRDGAPEPLRSQIDDFMYQESIHSREHALFNRQAEDAGYDIKPLEARTRATVEWARSRPPLIQLAATCALEHFTAVLAHALLSDARHMKGASSDAHSLWRWHAIEEIEHKAVAYDTWLYVTRHHTGLRRWARRSVVMATATARFHWVIYRNTADLLKQDGKNTLGAWAKLLGYLYGRPGPMRLLVQGAIGYMRPGFHPWHKDDRDLVAGALASLNTSGAKAPAE
ncbi:MAG: metal-dependent hydrolase [Oceanicaulis sp.]|nr:metal-dependent hydrolase [Oceanicaulis sp.]